MKALVLCGGIPQIALMKELRKRGIETILADMNERVAGRPYADKFFPVSALDVDAVADLASAEEVDFVLTACADQVLLVQAEVSERLGLPCYIDLNTARDVSSKEFMKARFEVNGVPSSKFAIASEIEELRDDLRYPLVVKPVDSYSSRGVTKVADSFSLRDAFYQAVETSRTGRVIVEEYVEGIELTIDAWVESGMARVLCISRTDKVPSVNGFVICRTLHPAPIEPSIHEDVQRIVRNVATAFGLKDTPLLVQMILGKDGLSVIECCARTGGGEKYSLIKEETGFDVISSLVDLTLGEKPIVKSKSPKGYRVTEFLYTHAGILDRVEGFEELKNKGIINDFEILKPNGSECREPASSGDRVAYYSVKGPDVDTVRELDDVANTSIRVLDNEGNDILRHDLVGNF